MHVKENNLTTMVKEITWKAYEKIINNLHAKRMKKDKTQLQAVLMLGSIRRVK
ncbi:MAG: hypothetical protein AB1499_17675 [Nitrospirota bacterium]